MAIPPISAVRTTGIQPVMPAADAEPWEEGLEVQATTEVVPVQVPDHDTVQEVSADVDAGLTDGAFARAASSIVSPTQVGGPAAARTPQDRPGGNARVTTGFDPTPAPVDTAPAARTRHASPLARAFAESR